MGVLQAPFPANGELSSQTLPQRKESEIIGLSFMPDTGLESCCSNLGLLKGSKLRSLDREDFTYPVSNVSFLFGLVGGRSSLDSLKPSRRYLPVILSEDERGWDLGGFG